ncbi:MAG: T9SS type A sorting domain-containing protein [Bacteroidales bacterium]|nr:T9SS type A sorting domain-containing protein [Bacteroidales bacterium]MDD4685316.1 T9SS type A sorting domain-containing protein [Bacteroidales bacterium]
MKKHIKHWFFGVLLSIISFASIAQAPILEVYSPDSISKTSAVLRGKVKRSPDGALLLSRGFALKTANSETYNYYTITSLDSIISFNAIDLAINTRYQVAVIALTMDSFYLSDTIGFNTLNTIINPQIISSEPTNITSTSTTLNGNLINYGNPLITEKGFLFSINPSFNYSTAQEIIPIPGIEIGDFSNNKIGLTPNTNYYYRTYAINSDTTILGDIVAFNTTSSSDISTQISTFNPEIINETTANFSGAILSIGSETISSIGFDLRKLSETIFSSHPISPVSDTFNLTVNNLDPGTTYIIRAYAITNSGKTFGETKNFTTPYLAGIFETLSPTSINSNSAILNGYISDLTTPVQAFGFAIKEDGGTYSLYDISHNFNLPCSLSYSLTNMTPYQNYTYKVYALGYNNTYFGDEVSFKTNSIASIVKTHAATNLSNNSAQLNGKLSNAGTPTIIEKGFIYSNQYVFDFSNSIKIIINGNAIEPYSHILTGLNQSTTYYYRSYSISPIDTNYGEVISFTTLMQNIIPPLLNTYEATNITYNSAMISGMINMGSENIINRGFQYKAEGDINYIDINIDESSASQTILTNLLPSTTYQFRVFASTSSTTYFGNELELSTPEIPMIITTNQPSSITINSATLNGNIYDGNEIVLFRGIEWKQTSDTIYHREFIIDAEAGNISLDIESLNSNTEYSYKVFARTEEGFFYGNEVNFLTNEIISPVVSNVIISDIDTNSAHFYGTIIEGNAPITHTRFLIKKWGQEEFLSHSISNNVLDLRIDTLEEGTTYYVEMYALTKYGVIKSETSSFMTLGTHSIGLNEIEKEDSFISIYPNPSSDIINIKLNNINNNDNLFFIISDIKGRVIDKRQIYTSSITYDISDFSKGIYTITIISNDIKQTKKLIIK